MKPQTPACRHGRMPSNAHPHSCRSLTFASMTPAFNRPSMQDPASRPMTSRSHWLWGCMPNVLQASASSASALAATMCSRSMTPARCTCGAWMAAALRAECPPRMLRGWQGRLGVGCRGSRSKPLIQVRGWVHAGSSKHSLSSLPSTSLLYACTHIHMRSSMLDIMNG